MVIQRFDIWLIELDPTKGSEMQKTRPCVIISPNEMNSQINTVLVAPLTSSLRIFPFRKSLVFKRRKEQIALDHLRSVDHQRLVNRVGRLSAKDAEELCAKLQDMFAFE